MCQTQSPEKLYEVETHGDVAVVRVLSGDNTNRLTRARVAALTAAIEKLACEPRARLIITGNSYFFSTGADLHEIAELRGVETFRFAQLGQLPPPSPPFAATAWAADSTWHLRALAGSPAHKPSSAIAERRWASSPVGEARNASHA